MGFFSFVVGFIIMLMLFVAVYQLQSVDRYGGLRQASLRHAKRCLGCLYAVLLLSLALSVRDAWRSFPNWYEMVTPLINLLVWLFLGYFVRLIHRAYLAKIQLVRVFSDQDSGL